MKSKLFLWVKSAGLIEWLIFLIFVLRNEYLRRCHTPASAGESIYVSDSGRLGAAGGPWQSCDCAFGKKRFYTAIVVDVHDRQPQTDYEVKEIFSILDATPILRRPQLRFWEWIASYYICKLGDVYKAALPSGLKLESETTVTYNPDFEADAPLKPNEQAVLDAFGRNVLKQTVSDLEKKTGLRNIVPVIASLWGKELWGSMRN